MIINLKKVTMRPQKNDYVTLSAAVKFCGFSSTGGEAKELIQSGLIKVNEISCSERGKKIKNGTIIEYQGEKIEVIIDESNANITF